MQQGRLHVAQVTLDAGRVCQRAGHLRAQLREAQVGAVGEHRPVARQCRGQAELAEDPLEQRQPAAGGGGERPRDVGVLGVRHQLEDHRRFELECRVAQQSREALTGVGDRVKALSQASHVTLQPQLERRREQRPPVGEVVIETALAHAEAARDGLHREGLDADPLELGERTLDPFARGRQGRAPAAHTLSVAAVPSSSHLIRPTRSAELEAKAASAAARPSRKCFQPS